VRIVHRHMIDAFSNFWNLACGNGVLVFDKDPKTRFDAMTMDWTSSEDP